MIFRIEMNEIEMDEIDKIKLFLTLSIFGHFDHLT